MRRRRGWFRKPVRTGLAQFVGTLCQKSIPFAQIVARNDPIRVGSVTIVVRASPMTIMVIVFIVELRGVLLKKSNQ